MLDDLSFLLWEVKFPTIYQRLETPHYGGFYHIVGQDFPIPQST
jgi:hypothetical protein